MGEIRDVETAEIAVQASLTGHMVFSTLHTNDAPSTVTRLRDMGVPPFLITATVEAILAQRLVRRICSGCREEIIPGADVLADLELTSDQAVGKKFYRGKGCEKCNRTGYKGRLGLYELLIMNDELRDMIMRNASTEDLREAARSNGMVTLRESGMEGIFGGPDDRRRSDPRNHPGRLTRRMGPRARRDQPCPPTSSKPSTPPPARKSATPSRRQPRPRPRPRSGHGLHGDEAQGPQGQGGQGAAAARRSPAAPSPSAA